MTIYRGTVFDTPEVEGHVAQLRADHDAALVVREGVIVDRTDFGSARERYPQDDVVDLGEGILLPGLIDTHVHFPQARIIGGLGMPLLQWLDECALPEEVRLGERGYAQAVADDFLGGLISAGTTTALVFGSHFPQAMETLFAAAEKSGLRITSGLTVSDRILPEQLLLGPEEALAEGRRLAETWHGRGRLRYAVTPRFSLSASDELLASCAELLTAEYADPLWFTTHINENPAEIDEIGRLFPESTDYLDTYANHGLLSERSVFAHNVHPTPSELPRLAEAGSAVAHCPTSNAALGSGLFPFREHREAGVQVALGSDVGAGTGFSLLKEGLQCYFGQQLRGAAGVALTPADLLRLATSAGAAALGLQDRVGDLSVGKAFDAVWVSPSPGGALDGVLPYARDDDDALAKVFALGGPADIARVWVGGDVVG